MGRQLILVFACVLATVLPRTGLAMEQAFVLPKTEIGGDGVDPQRAKAFADAGDAYGRGDFNAAFKGWRRLADEGLAPALYNLGVMFEHGRGMAVDYRRAAAWYRRAARRREPAAMVNLARLLFEGRGIERDEGEAVRLLEEAASLGSAPAQFNLGVVFLRGMGTAVDIEEAAVWFEMAAEAGHPRAAYNLAVLYQRGDGIEKNLQEAARFYGIAAGAGDALSHYALALLPATGGKAVEHLRIAARAGVTLAQNRLAIMLARGDGVRRDRETALMWFQVAAGMGAENAARNRDSLAVTVTPEQRARAEKRARAFRPVPAPKSTQ